ncbi:hypothetical protein D3C86_1480550 [compost metagenome]
MHDLHIIFGCGPNHHLSALSGWYKLRYMFYQLPLFAELLYFVLHNGQRTLYGLMAFLRRDLFQPFFCRHFQVDAHTVYIKARFIDQFLAGAWYGFQVYIPVITLFCTQLFYDFQ